MMNAYRANELTFQKINNIVPDYFKNNIEPIIQEAIDKMEFITDVVHINDLDKYDYNALILYIKSLNYIVSYDSYDNNTQRTFVPYNLRVSYQSFRISWKEAQQVRIILK